MDTSTYSIYKKDTPIIALALHDGHFIPSKVLSEIKLQEHERFREEDPYTSFMADLPVTKVIVHASRFYVDLNRLPDKAIYKAPEDAWGLHIWKNEFPAHLEQEMMDYYHGFYEKMEKLIEETIDKFGHFIILDIHSYNHRRRSPGERAPENENPEINIGTAYNHLKWKKITQTLIDHLSGCLITDHRPDVRENVVFKGGGFSQWANGRYKEEGCVISIEFKKTFMDEWTGRGYISHILDIKTALRGLLPVLMQEPSAEAKQ